MDYVSKLSEQQIKKIILKSKQRFKSNIINNYSKMLQSKLPLWFSEGLKKLESYKDELFNVPIMNPIFCNIIDISKLGVKIWHQIFDKNQIKLHIPDKIFEFSFSEYDNIYSGIKNALDDYKINTGWITYIRVYSKKVDTALTYTYKKNKIAYLLIVEAKLPNVPFHGVYDKLLRSINDAINSFLIYIAKDAKIITRTLKNLLTKLRWIAIFVAEGKFSLMAIKLMDNHQLQLCFFINEAKIPAKPDNISDSIFLLSLFIYIKETVNKNLKILSQIDQEIEITKYSHSEGNHSLQFLNKTIYATLSTPVKTKK
ncbi:10535_t:CDS:2 [Gigaspora margarita]|uniref:10535_t:CDS:1 n=1 Tax=Gigaspora margarita TaxID=4874 RepID=A0ABN7VT51_GIGMA|nr:10535_t:CDS:2 [Gigaspora margarita]